MYLLFALILYLKAQGIKIAWYWYLLALCEACDSANKTITLKRKKSEDNND